jgi:NAD(P)-dependent dehydrogenase (short-subunit alcohol dehydrogenase family)
MSKVWFITRNSRGLGRSLTEAVLQSGDNVFATARDIGQLDDLNNLYPQQIFPFQLDLTDYAAVHNALDSAIGHFGVIDVLVNNAGFGIVGAAERIHMSRSIGSRILTCMHQS